MRIYQARAEQNDSVIAINSGFSVSGYSSVNLAWAATGEKIKTREAI